MTNFSFFIARRYLFSPKSHHAINIISMISVIGIALATTALVVILSVFNGFHDLVASLFTAFDPELKVVPAQGKTFNQNDPTIRIIRNYKDVQVASGSLENHALACYNGRQTMVILKGVEDNFGKCTDIQKILYGNNKFILHADVLNYAIPGIRLAMLLGMGTDFTDPLEIYTPRPGEKVNMMNPTQSFNHDELNSSGSVFNVSQKTYDSEYILCPLSFAQKMFEKSGQISSLELKLKNGSDIASVKKALVKITGTKFKVLDRYEQQEDVFRIMKVEKLMAYIFLTFILVIACFNIIGSLSMLIIDKRQDIGTLHDLGANDKRIRQIFLYEGRMISFCGAMLGLVIGILLCWLQMHFGLIRLGEQSGTFIVDAYPVSIHVWDLIIIFVTVVAVSFASSWYPVRYLSRRLLNGNDK